MDMLCFIDPHHTSVTWQEKLRVHKVALETKDF